MANDRTRGGVPQMRRASPEVRANRAQSMLDNPDLRGVFDTARAEIITDIETVNLDGSEAKTAEAVEHVRKLQALLHIKRIILRPVAAQMLAQNSVNKESLKDGAN